MTNWKKPLQALYLRKQKRDPFFTEAGRKLQGEMDDRIKRLNGHTDEYLRMLNEMDKQEEADGIPGKLTKELCIVLAVG